MNMVSSMEAWKRVKWSLVSVLVTVLCLGLSTPAKAGDGREVIEIMPANTAFMLVLDFEKLRGTAIFDQLESALGIHPTIAEGYERFVEHTGFDLNKDLETLIVVLGEDFPEPGNYLIVGKGRFQRDLFVEFARDQGGTVTENNYRDHTIYEVDLDGGMVFHQDLFFTGNLSALRAAIDNIAGAGESMASNSKMMELVDEVETQASLWVVSHLSEARRAELASSYPLIGELSSLSVHADLSDGLDCKLTIAMISERGAMAVEDVLADIETLAALEPNLQTMGLEPIIRGTQPSRKGNVITVLVKLDPSQVEAAQAGLAAIITAARKQFQ